MPDTSSIVIPPTDLTVQAPFFENKDWFLQEYVHLAELGVEQGITLTVGGSVITGTVISGKSYFSILATELLSAIPEDHPSRETVSIIAKNYMRYSEEVAPKEGEEEKFERNYIHMKNTKIIQGNYHIPSGQGALWRGKINAIDSFINGQMNFD